VNRQQCVRNQTVRLAGANRACPLAAPNASKGSPTPSSLAEQISRSGLCSLLGIVFFAFLCTMAPLNKASFGLPNGSVFAGKQSDKGTFSDPPISTAGQITSTLTSSRQIQLALKLIF
jgi:hypothetical protein